MRFTRSTQWVLVVVATLLTIASGQISSVVRQPPSQQYSSPQQQQQAARQQKYSGNINLVSDSVTNLAQRIARAISNQKSKTEIFSPVSIAGALSLLLLGSGGQTQKELLKVMGLDTGALSFQDIHLGFGRLFQDLVSNEPSLEPLVTWRQNDKCNRFDEEEDDEDYPLPPAANSANDTQVEIHLANGIFAQDGTAFDDRYNALAKKLYKSELQYLDFVGSESKSVRTINGWVYNQTRGRIGDILSNISPETILLIVNTLYFRGLWEEPFLNLATRPRRFFPNGPDGPGSFDVPTMAKSGCMPYYLWKEENVRVLGVPYQQNVTMYIFFPNDSTRARVTALHEKLSAQTVNEIVTKMTMKSVSLLLPQMHVSNAFSLKSAFQQMGLYALFDRETADLYHLLTSKRRGDGGEELEDIFEALEDTKENAIQYLMKQNPNCVVLEKQGVDRVTCLKDSCRLGGDVCVCCADSDDDFRRRRRDTATDYGGDQANSTIYVTEMLHKVDLVVNERGTEGGAATATLIDRISSQITFLVNGPFLMIIREETTRLPLFYGSIFSPK
ncbi:serine protease inhibitor 28Dc-like isoform X2 [Anopheles cruzii]|uniref:serine protease inhibitor 28Dc-like isoform X2 n=1 Tax=Anopheles cruzii TaxID=68878 RepID=UPI0022EC60A4|nr:serine protease inhibitor 28Dc-like isoform X2 [Anopheles cruzii]